MLISKWYDQPPEKSTTATLVRLFNNAREALFYCHMDNRVQKHGVAAMVVTIKNFLLDSPDCR